MPTSHTRPTRRSRVGRCGTRHAVSYAFAIATAKPLPTHTRPKTPTTVASRRLSRAFETASVTVCAAEPFTPNQSTMSSATWRLLVERKPSTAIANTATANNARNPYNVIAAAVARPCSSTYRR